jgi:Sec-independent protein secretion pathway component TatC
MGIVPREALRTHRTSILVGLWTASCFITPGADPYSPVILGVAFTVLFFVSTGLIGLLGPASMAAAIQIPPPGVVASAGGAAGRPV